MTKEAYKSYKNIEKVLSGTKYTLDDYKKIINSLEDEKSKYMAYYRVMYDNTHDPKYIYKLIKSSYLESEIIDMSDRMMLFFVNFMLKDNNYSKFLNIIGLNTNDMGLNSWILLDLIYFRKKDEYMVYDKVYGYDIPTAVGNVFVSDITDIKLDNNAIYLICNNDEKFKQMLIDDGIKEENIFIMYEQYTTCRNEPYFDETFFNHISDEVFIDGGAFDMNTTLKLKRRIGNNLKKVYAFEPLEKEYLKCKEIIERENLQDKIEVVNLGLWNKLETLSFNNTEFGDGRIDENGLEYLKCDSIDNVLNGNKATMIKLDIEGVEKEALIGAKKTIKKYNPLLMVCIYHKPNDIFEIFNLINSYNPKYHFFIRHFSYYNCETVLYAIPDNRLIDYNS